MALRRSICSTVARKNCNIMSSATSTNCTSNTRKHFNSLATTTTAGPSAISSYSNSNSNSRRQRKQLLLLDSSSNCPAATNTNHSDCYNYNNQTHNIQQLRRLHKDFSMNQHLKTSTQKKSSASEDSSSSISKPSESVLPQIATPNTEELFEGTTSFKGLETDFPCLASCVNTGPEPDYEKVTDGYHLLQTDKPFHLSLNQGVLPRLEVAYETWGELNEDRSNAVVVMGGLSASSHARSHPKNESPGWWEKFVGPGCAVDTDKFFVICPNNLGSCYGTSGPSSINVLNGEPYATTFPIIGVDDMTNAIFTLLEHLGISKLYAAVGSSMGGMLSLQSAVSYPEQVGKVITISSCAQSHPSSIAMRYLQRKCIMSDPHWNKGHYYDGTYPKNGMKLAREIATMTYRSGPEWDQRFGRNRINREEHPSLCPTFLIESYLDYQGEKFSTKYDPNSLLYISKAMDIFDIAEGFPSLSSSLKRVQCPVMVVGVQTDILFPIWQQRELAEALHQAGHEETTFYELNSIYGHDTFLLDLNGVGTAVKGFLETKQKETGWLTKHKTTGKS